VNKLFVTARATTTLLVATGATVGLMGAVPASADSRVKAVQNVNIRSGPSTHRAKIGLLKRSHTASAISAAKGWTKIRFTGSTAYISSRYLVTALPKVTGTRHATTALLIRSTSKSKNFKVIATVSKASQLKITKNLANGRTQVIYNNKARWVITKYLTKRVPVKNPTPTPEYAVEKGLTPSMIAVHRGALVAWPTIKTYYGYRNDPSSDHYSGRALDLMLPNYTTASGKALGAKVAAWGVANLKQYGIDYVIYNQHIYSGRRASEGWRLMADRGSDSANHKNHVHISVLK
jgi:uncharacterized protein YgiM (DUF1202 family)